MDGAKRFVALAMGLLAALLSAEVVTRVYFAFEVGPRILAYGSDWYRNASPDPTDQMRRRTVAAEDFRADARRHFIAERGKASVELHRNERAGYTKFFPGERKSTRNVDTGARIRVRINAQGFRGDDFSVQKPAGVVRVLTLGASSTFGFYNADEETYPYQLGRILDDRCPGRRHEVVNFGIPHATSENIAALFLAEGLPLEPDVVTFYHGRNDSVLVEPSDGWLGAARAAAIPRLLVAAFVDQVLVGERTAVTATSQSLAAYEEARSREYQQNLTTILEACRRLGIVFIVANQQATSTSPFPRSEAERLRLKGTTYAEETRRIRDRMAKGGDVDLFEYSLLVHQRMMNDLRAWATREGVPFVDVIAALDRDRHLLLSWVHLHPEANRVVAEKLADEIVKASCG